MKTRKLLYSLLFVFVFSLATTVTAEASTATVKISVKYGQTEAREMLDGINKFRTSKTWYWNESNTKKVTVKGRKALKYDYELEKVAMQRAAEIAMSFSHTRPNNKRCFTAYTFDSGCMGENIAAGYETQAEALKGWRENNEKYDGQGHRRNMLVKDFKYVAVGHAYYNGYHYWVQLFSSTAGSTKKTTANDKDTTVKVKCDSSRFKSVKAETKTITLVKGETYNLNKIKFNLKAKDIWPEECSSRNTTISTTWSTDNKKIASISGKTLTANKAGTTKITTKILDKTVTVTVKVTSK